MKLKIKSIILWPKDNSLKIRVIPFKIDKVNVISGGNAKGKSALISIVDYCLGSGKCTIPIGYIRNLTEWFGIIVVIDNLEILLARKEPGNEVISGEMYIKKADKIVIPEIIESNANYKDIIQELNNYANLVRIDFKSNENDKGFLQSISFRDLTALNFQTQHLIANPYALFYKADTYKHREKLITIFPYILGIIDNHHLELKEELKVLQKEESLLIKLLEERKALVNQWISEVKSYYAISFELGLIKGELVDNNWTFYQYVDSLRKALSNLDSNSIPSIQIGATSAIAQRISNLDNKEFEISQTLQKKQEKLYLLRNIQSGNIDYTSSLTTQKHRLDAASWFGKRLKESALCPFCGSDSTKSQKYIESYKYIYNNLQELSSKSSDMHKVFNYEISEIIKELNGLENELNQVRNEKQILRNENNLYREQRQRIDSIYKFGGKLELSLNNYDKISNNSELQNKIDKITARLSAIRRELDETKIEEKKRKALKDIADRIKFYAEIFDAEYYKTDIEFDIDNLTLRFSSNKRKDYLWEIGSGHNFMSYHISTILAIHEYLLTLADNKVPSLIMFDQPSQVYFPELKDNQTINEEAYIKVKNIFKVLSEFNKRTKNNVQIIIIEHAGESTWKEYSDEIVLAKNWRNTNSSEDKALIPQEWIDKIII